MMSNQQRKEILRAILSISLTIVGITHFTHADQYARIIPPQLPNSVFWVYLSGAIEILLAIALMIPYLSVAAAWGMIALFIAVFPANINQAINSIPIDGIPHNPIAYWIRLPFQAVLIAWAWWYTRKPETQAGAADVAAHIEAELNR